jgi:hypothetical protein
VDGKITREFVSLLMESPFYLMLPVRERYSLLMRLIDNYHSTINEYFREKQSHCEESAILGK